MIPNHVKPQAEPDPDDLTAIVKRFLMLRKQGGAVSVLSVFILTVIIFLRLAPDQVQRLKEVWWIISIPAVLMLIAWMFGAYIDELKNRTAIEESIHGILAKLAGDFDRLFAHSLDDKMYMDKRFDSIEDRLALIQSKIM